MSAFRSLAASPADAPIKVLVWGPPGSGKTYFGLSAPDPVVVNFELRALEHHHRGDGAAFAAKVAEPRTTEEGITALEELVAGRVPCRSVVADSLSIPYHRYARALTTKSDRGKWSTDYANTNKLMRSVTDPLFSIPGVNVIATARQIVRREGERLVANGVKLLGDEQLWRYETDYVLHFTGRGWIIVEKSMSPHLSVESIIRGDLDWDRFRRLIAGEESIEQPRSTPHTQREPSEPMAAAVDPLGALTDSQARMIRKRAADAGVDDGRLALLVRSVMPNGAHQLDAAHIHAVLVKFQGAAA